MYVGWINQGDQIQMNEEYINMRLTREDLELADVQCPGYDQTELIKLSLLNESDLNKAILYIKAEIRFQREARKEQ